MGSSLPPIQWVRVIPGGKAAGRGVNHPLSSGAEVNERVDLYLCFPSGTLWPVVGRTLPLPTESADPGGLITPPPPPAAQLEKAVLNPSSCFFFSEEGDNGRGAEFRTTQS